MKKILLTTMLFSAALFGSECSLGKSDDVKIGWTAFKTPLKAGVKGGFDTIEYTGVKRAASLPALLEKSEIVIATKSVNSGNEGRDAKLVTFFFQQMKGDTIRAKVDNISGDDEKGVITVTLEMNGVQKSVPMRYIVENNRFEAAGVLDLADFEATGALNAINQACFELHQGKTWQDVEVRFGMDLHTDCR